MKSTTALPSGYNEIYSLDLQKDKKTALLVNILSLLLAALTFIVGMLIAPLSGFFDIDDSLIDMFIKIGIAFGGMFLYIILHELVHGICMKFFVHTKIRYGFTGLYAYAGCDAYFNKRDYIIIALAPIVVWGIVLALICGFLPIEWFWVFHFIQLINISGAAGDIYVTYKFSRMPTDILVHDTGVAMTVYSAG